MSGAVETLRDRAFECIVSQRQAFEEHFSRKGAVALSPVPVSARIDSTVRFVGSHTSVCKPFLKGEKDLPKNGLYIAQPCLKAKNFKYHFNDVSDPLPYGSFCEFHGLLHPFHDLEKVTADFLSYLTQTLSIPTDEIQVSYNPDDDDLVKALGATNFPPQNMFPNSMEEKRYTHLFGKDVAHIKGRNLHVLTKNKQTGEFSSMAVIIVMEDKGKPVFVETAISPSVITMQKFGLEHILDCYPVSEIDTDDTTARRKLEDSIIAGSVLFREGLRPGGTGNRRQKLRDFMKAAARHADCIGITDEYLFSVAHSFEQRFFPDSFPFMQTEPCAEELCESVKRYRQYPETSRAPL